MDVQLLGEQQKADHKVMIRWNKASRRKPFWYDVSPQSRAVKTVRSQWLLFMKGALYNTLENHIEDPITHPFFFPTLSDRLPLRLINVTRLQVIVVYEEQKRSSVSLLLTRTYIKPLIS